MNQLKIFLIFLLYFGTLFSSTFASYSSSDEEGTDELSGEYADETLPKCILNQKKIKAHDDFTVQLKYQKISFDKNQQIQLSDLDFKFIHSKENNNLGSTSFCLEPFWDGKNITKHFIRKFEECNFMQCIWLIMQYRYELLSVDKDSQKACSKWYQQILVDSSNIRGPIKRQVDGFVHDFVQRSKMTHFLLTTSNWVSSYQVQKSKSLYNVRDLNDWGRTGARQGIIITRDNLDQFSKKLIQNGIPEADSMLSLVHWGALVKPNDSNRSSFEFVPDQFFAQLKIILEAGFSPTIIKETNDVTTIKGFNIVWSDIESKINPKVDVEIFGLDTVFLDRNVELYGKNLLIVAPNIKIIGSVSVHLPGPDRARGNTGPVGSHGEPGFNGGNFFGVYMGIEGCLERVISKGGWGGDGQKGSRGLNGQDGLVGTKPSNGYWYNQYHKAPWTIERGKTFSFKGDTLPNHVFIIPDDDYTSSEEYIWTIDVMHKDQKGKQGGSGGRGGTAGYGGKGGAVEWIGKFGGGLSLRYEHDVGRRGRDGEGGDGGSGGLHGPIQSCIIKFGSNDWVTYYSCDLAIREEEEDKRASDGPAGQRYIFSSFSSVNDNRVFVKKSPIKKWTSLTNYKSYFREFYFDQRFVNLNYFDEFYNWIDTDPQFHQIHDIPGFLNEFNHLEKQFQVHRMKLLPFYEILLRDIDYFISNNSLNSDEKHIFILLYTAINSKIFNLKYDTNSNLVINIGDHLANIIKWIEESETTNNEIKVRQLQDEYSKEINETIDEASKIISKNISPEIDSILTQINSNVEKLIVETRRLKEEGENKTAELLEKRKELENQLKFKGLFSGLNIVTSMLSFCGPFGSGAAGAIGSVTQITESLTIGQVGKGTSNWQVPPGVKSGLENTRRSFLAQKDIRNSNIDALIEKLNLDTLNSPNETPSESLGQLIKLKMDRVILKDKYKRKEINDLDYNNDLEKLNTNIITNSKKAAADMKSHKAEKNEKVQNFVKNIDKISSAVRVMEVSLDTYNRYKNDQNEIDQIDKEIKDSNYKLDNLREFENSITSTMVPEINAMEEYIKNMEKNLRSKSQAMLDFSQWKVSSLLKDLRSEIKLKTEGFQIQANFLRSIENLDEAISTMIKIYDRIQTYQKEKKLRDLIVNINTGSGIYIQDFELKNQFLNLKQTIESNLIIDNYQKAMNAFNQWVFPFAHLFLGKLNSPKFLDLQINWSLKEKISLVTTHLRALDKKISDYKTSIVKHIDDHQGFGNYNPRVGTRPFYLWSNNEVNMTELFSGGSINLLANIRHPKVPDRWAVKFSEIGIDFKIKDGNSTKQNEIDKIITHFKLTMIHSGKSDYNYGGKIYTIWSQSQEIWYNFGKNEKGESTHYNSVYRKLKEGNILLSPYTTWTISLENVGIKSNSEAFGELAKFSQLVDMTLVGFGSSVNKNINIPLYLDNYYKVA